MRTVRVEAAFALVRCGWRGAEPKFEGIYREALRMLERERTSVDIFGTVRFFGRCLGPQFGNGRVPDAAHGQPRATAVHGRHVATPRTGTCEEAIMPALWSFTAVRWNITSALVS